MIDRNVLLTKTTSSMLILITKSGKFNKELKSCLEQEFPMFKDLLKKTRITKPGAIFKFSLSHNGIHIEFIFLVCGTRDEPYKYLIDTLDLLLLKHREMVITGICYFEEHIHIVGNPNPEVIRLIDGTFEKLLSTTKKL